MHLQNDELIIKVFHHHPFPLAIGGLKTIVVSLPFFFVATFFRGILSDLQLGTVYSTIGIVFFIIMCYFALINYMDHLIVTNQRILYVNWKTLFSREENEVELRDIQDITTNEFGVLSWFKIFDYGTFEVQTAGSKVAILFKDAADPEGIKHFIYHLLTKPSKIYPMNAPNSLASYHDQATAKDEQKSGVSGNIDG